MDTNVNFIVRIPWKDGHLLERMNDAGLPSELKTTDSLGRYFSYTCPAELLRALVNAGCPAVIVGDKALQEYVFSQTIKE